MEANNKSFLELIASQRSLQSSATFNLPYVYKGVSFYPVMADRLFEFSICSEVLKIRQERTKIKKLIKMPYLHFLIHACENWEEYERADFSAYIPALFALLEMVTKSANINIDIERKQDGRYRRCILLIDEVEFSANEFMEIRNIIFEQNGIENIYDDFVNEDAEKAVQERRENEWKKSEFIPPSTDDLVSKFCVQMRVSKKEFQENYSVRDFNIFIDEISRFTDYKIMQTGAMSGMVKYEKPIPHWLGAKKKFNMFEGENTDYRNSSLYQVGGGDIGKLQNPARK